MKQAWAGRTALLFLVLAAARARGDGDLGKVLHRTRRRPPASSAGGS